MHVCVRACVCAHMCGACACLCVLAGEVGGQVGGWLVVWKRMQGKQFLKGISGLGPDAGRWGPAQSTDAYQYTHSSFLFLLLIHIQSQNSRMAEMFRTVNLLMLFISFVHF